MVVAQDGRVPLPWLATPLAQTLAKQRGHALLVQGSEGIGVLHFVLTLAQAWLCEAAEADRARGPCGRCASCKLVQSHLHPDLQVLMPEVLRRQHAWLRTDDKADADESKRKPSKQIRIDEVRSVIDWVFKTSGRGRGKVVVLHPADSLNAASANALLKTLEEPPPGTRIVLSAADPALLLPTVRSRCQLSRLAVPTAAESMAWLGTQGVADAAVLLAASSGRPLDALVLVQAGILAEHWRALPAAVARGQAGALAGWPLPRLLDTLHKLCHDAMAVASGGAPVYFPPGSVPAAAALPALAAWSRELGRIARHDEHPWHEGLMLDVLLAGAARALAPPTLPRAAPGGVATL
ncbi:MAG: DNA polymerase III subunit delta' [Rubrivivax sp.]|nr:DNA polymerase III subunit delta' [Rubrivivax sp.]